MYYFPNVDPIYIYKRKGTEDDPYISLIDENNVRNGVITLKEIPHFDDKVKAKVDGAELTEVNVDSLSDSEFRIDYTTGVAYFNTNLNGKTVVLEYTGTGYVSMPASRIWMTGDHETPLESLEEVLDRVDEGVQVLDSMSDFSFMGSYNDSMSYNKWNFVFYNNKTYVAKTSVKGENPNNSEKWQLISSGVGFMGVFNSDHSYNVGDIISDEESKNIYFSKVDDNTSPLNDENAWELMLTMDDISEKITKKLEELDDFALEFTNSEDIRDENESQRQNTFEELILNIESLNDLIQAEEEVRIENENDRQTKETSRQNKEEERIQNETERVANEANRILAEEERVTSLEELKDSILENVDNSIVEMDILKDTVSETREEVVSTLTSIQEEREEIEGEFEKMLNFSYAGDFDEEIEYKEGNIVSHEGSSYIALGDVEGIDVSNPDYWGVLALKGLSNSDVTIEGVEPDETGDFSLEYLQVVRTPDFEEYKQDTQLVLGDLDSLRTLNKEDLVSAINELKKRIDDIIEVLADPSD